MKKLILSIAVLALAAISASAQINLEAGMSLGNYKYNNNFTSKPALNFGVSYDIFMGSAGGEDLFIEPGVRFVMKNAALTNESNISLNLSWLEVPVYFGSSVDLGNFTLVGKVGIYYAYDLSQTVKQGDKTYNLFDGTVSNIISTLRGTDSVIIKRHDLGFTGAAMIYYNFIGVGVGYSYGLLNVANQSNSSAHTSCLTLNLGVRF